MQQVEEKRDRGGLDDRLSLSRSAGSDVGQGPGRLELKENETNCSFDENFLSTSLPLPSQHWMGSIIEVF